jgi:hypothetical protein
VTTDASSTSDEELYEHVSRYWSSRGSEVYRASTGVAATGADGDHFSTVYLSPSDPGEGPSIRVQLSCASE